MGFAGAEAEGGGVVCSLWCLLAPADGARRTSRRRRLRWTARAGGMVPVAAGSRRRGDGVARLGWIWRGKRAERARRGKRVKEEARGDARALPLSPPPPCSVGGGGVSAPERRARARPGGRRQREGEKENGPDGPAAGALCT
jgi:hypothetical protein